MWESVVEIFTSLCGLLPVLIPTILIVNLASDMLFGR